MTTQLIQHEAFGSIRTQMIKGEPWFIAKDVCDVLGYARSRDALKQHVLDDQKGAVICDTPGGKQELITINESGLYRLILRSRMPEAERFTDWVTSEVLPQIRKTGSYQARQTVRPLKLVPYEGQLCVEYSWLVSSGIVTRDALSAQISRGTVTRLRKGGGAGHTALLVYDTIPRKYRERIEAMYGLPHIEASPEAYRYTHEDMLELVAFITHKGATKQAIIHRLLAGKENTSETLKEEV